MNSGQGTGRQTTNSDIFVHNTDIQEASLKIEAISYIVTFTGFFSGDVINFKSSVSRGSELISLCRLETREWSNGCAGVDVDAYERIFEAKVKGLSSAPPIWEQGDAMAGGGYNLILIRVDEINVSAETRRY